MSNKIPKEIQDALNEMMAKLADKGVKVQAKAFQMGENGIEELGAEDKVGDMLKEVGVETSENQDGPCFCPNCFNFETFEKQLGETGTFDYKTLEFSNGKVFNVKYYEGKYGEQIMMQPVGEPTKEELQKQFEDAVKAKDYKLAQELLQKLENF